MHIRLPMTLAAFAVSAITPLAATAATCGDYNVSPEQAQFLQEQLTVVIPEGEVPVIRRCDTNADNVVDIDDIRAITASRNMASAHPDDPMDWDKNNWIDMLDARGCQQACTAARCARVPEPPAEPPANIPQETAACFQADDLDGDGEQDLAGIFENTGGVTRGDDWTLEVVILNKDAAGNVKAVTYPYSGQNAAASGELRQHLSKQPAGVVNLNPGTVTIDNPAVVSYRNGQPKVLYFIKDGEVTRAFFGIDD